MILLADLTSTDLGWRIGIGLAGLVTGGLGGAVLNQVMNWRTSRKQPINHRTEVEPLLPKKTGVKINAQATIDGQPYEIMRVSIVTIEIVNTGLKDYTEFDFSVLVNKNERIIAFATPDPTPFHVMDGADASVSGNPKSATKFTCKPFNRGDTYSCKLIVFAETDDSLVREPTIGSTHPVNFVASPSIGQMVLEAAKGTALNFGPFSVRIG